MSKVAFFSDQLGAFKGDVAAIRLITGEELLARVNEINGDHVVLDQPRVLLAQLRHRQDGTPVMAAQILNWMNSDPETTVPVLYEDMMSVIEPEANMKNEYIRFTTGIEIVSAGSIIK